MSSKALIAQHLERSIYAEFNFHKKMKSRILRSSPLDGQKFNYFQGQVVKEVVVSSHE